MSKQSQNATFKNIDLNDDWTSHPAVEWLSANKQIIMWVAFGLLALLILAYRLISAQTANAERDYYRAQNDFAQFQQISVMNEQAQADLKQLTELMNRHPELKYKYEGALAQTLLILGQTSEAKAFEEGVFQRTSDEHLNLYQQYAKTSLLIGEGHYQEALQQAQQLQQALDQRENVAANPILYTYNLFRLAILHQQLGQTEQELATWERVQNLPLHFDAWLSMIKVIKTGQASLNQYIDERKAALSNLK